MARARVVEALAFEFLLYRLDRGLKKIAKVGKQHFVIKTSTSVDTDRSPYGVTATILKRGLAVLETSGCVKFCLSDHLNLLMKNPILSPLNRCSIAALTVPVPSHLIVQVP
jgi:hypothetical protein